MRVKALIRGIVQGVGFRPFVHNLAAAHRLSGRVANEGRGVDLELEGPAEAIEAFFQDLLDLKPPLAHIIQVQKEVIPETGQTDFMITASQEGAQATALIPPDTATCDDCAAELADPVDRRYRYPFINCTNCGPRYTIIHGLPYDRPKTTMSGFAMCPDCLAEYGNPADRRFHAQPNACPVCGPQVRLIGPDGQPWPVREQEDDPIQAAAWALAQGKIAAVKGLGGFHLAVDAAGRSAVERLRRRKGREEKPLAVMVPDLASARRLVELSRADEALLTSPQRPIVLAPKRPDHGLAEAVSPGGKYLGVMLPYTPVHHLLLADFSRLKSPGVLVMTSGNVSEEPMETDNDSARAALGHIADLFLIHNRPIQARIDDSVAMSLLGAPRLIRRARGYIPRPVFLDSPGPAVLAVGPELKNTVCLTRGEEAFLSGHIGDLENLETLEAFEQTIGHLKKLLSIEPRAIAHDLHPDYLSTQWAVTQYNQNPELPLIRVQHHVAHILGLMAELGLARPGRKVVGLAMDGTGYGPDGTVWGGEILIVSTSGWQRFGHLATFPLPGGALAIRQPWRTALGLLRGLDGPAWPQRSLAPVAQAGQSAALLEQMMVQGLNCPQTSSLGRLFDGMAALAGLRQVIAYEGQAAIELEACLDPAEKGAYDFDLDLSEEGLVVNHRPLIARAAADAQAGVSPGRISARFHRGLARALTGAASLAAQAAGTDQVALSGGCFMNSRLTVDLVRGLEAAGLKALIHRDIPANDGGLALGQALAARLALERNEPEMWEKPTTG